jgi:hypothetical protein
MPKPKLFNNQYLIHDNFKKLAKEKHERRRKTKIEHSISWAELQDHVICCYIFINGYIGGV